VQTDIPEESDLSICAGEKTSAQSMAAAVPLKCLSTRIYISDEVKFNNSLTIIYHNTRGLRDKTDELICSLTSNNINCYICLSEHYTTEQNFKCSHPVAFHYLINNYNFQSNTTCNIIYALQL